MIVSLRSIVIVCCVIACVVCTPAHTVKPLPNFVDAALAPGDRVRVETNDGKTTEFVITEIRDESIFGDQHQIRLNDIAKLEKLAWSRPESPCGGGQPLGCSVPLLIRVASDSEGYYRDVFYDACVQHDYCYRHGYRSYGVDREACDTEFLEDMCDTCPEAAGNPLGRVIELLRKV